MGSKEWKEGVDCSKVEPSIECHDGESIQVDKNYLRNFYLKKKNK